MRVKLKEEIKETVCFWGPIEDIAGKELDVFDEAMDGSGDCLCMVSGRGLVDVKNEDIEEARRDFFDIQEEDDGQDERAYMLCVW